jgi:hypothetical protein
MSFDYESKRWGAARLAPRPWFMNGLKLRYLLSDLAPIHGRVLDVAAGQARWRKRSSARGLTLRCSAAT